MDRDYGRGGVVRISRLIWRACCSSRSMRQLLILSAPIALLNGCVVTTGRYGTGLWWGGGGIGLFLLIFIAALLFGRHR